MPYQAEISQDFNTPNNLITLGTFLSGLAIAGFFVVQILPAWILLARSLPQQDVHSGSVILLVIFVRGMFHYADPENVESQLIWGLGVPNWIVIILALLGIVFMVIARAKLPDFFRLERRVVAGDAFTTGFPPVPSLD